MATATDTRAPAELHVVSTRADKIWGTTRIGIGLIFLWAFFDKLLVWALPPAAWKTAKSTSSARQPGSTEDRRHTGSSTLGQQVPSQSSFKASLGQHGLTGCS